MPAIPDRIQVPPGICHVTMWRRMQRVVMRSDAGGITVHKNVQRGAMNYLEGYLAQTGWEMRIGNGCRTVWVR